MASYMFVAWELGLVDEIRDCNTQVQNTIGSCDEHCNRKVTKWRAGEASQ